MTILDQLYPGSFRGISFNIESSSIKGGRKTVQHEFPNSDRRYVEDLGLQNEVISITASVPSDVYFARRDAFKSALEAQGYGTLVHPYYGLRKVAVNNYTINETPSESGYVQLSIEFLVGQDLPYPGADASEDFIIDEVSNLFDSLKTSFFNGYEWVAKYAHNATSIIGGLTDITNIVESVSSTFTTRSEFDDASVAAFRASFNEYKEDKASYISTTASDDVNLYDQTRDMLELLDLVTNTGSQGFDVGRKLFDFTLSAPIPTATTAALTSKAANLNSLQDMVRVLAFGITCKNAAVYSVKSLDDLNIVRDEIDAQYESLLNTLTLSGQVLQDIQTLRSKTIRYLDAQVLTAPEIQEVATNGLPLTVVEYQYYGDLKVYGVDAEGDIDSRTEDLRLLNRLTNPDPTYLTNTVKIYSNNS